MPVSAGRAWLSGAAPCFLRPGPSWLLLTVMSSWAVRGEEQQLTLATMPPFMTAPPSPIFRRQLYWGCRGTASHATLPPTTATIVQWRVHVDLDIYNLMHSISHIYQLVCLEANIEVHIVALVTGDEALESAKEAAVAGSEGQGSRRTC